MGLAMVLHAQHDQILFHGLAAILDQIYVVDDHALLAAYIAEVLRVAKEFSFKQKGNIAGVLYRLF